jgi:hypothetical protein
MHIIYRGAFLNSNRNRMTAHTRIDAARLMLITY